ncbi:MAG: hypothetical protein FJ276_00560 [Planctomycetes bacterium]|nr:hypothetical protein [Planctomycetota bacterium]
MTAGELTAGELTADASEELERNRELARARKLGTELGLYTTGDYQFNWGGLEEKWLRGADGSWYFVTPNGELYRWRGKSNVLQIAGRLIKRHVFGDKSVRGDLIATFGDPPSRSRRNVFHDDPRRLTARVLRTVTTGPEVLAELASPGGSMWPVGTGYSDEERAVIARRRALDRLKGSMYGPEPYEDFRWTSADLPRVVRGRTLEALPSGWPERVDGFVGELVAARYQGDRGLLLADSLIDKERHWNALFAALGVEPPGLQTSIIVTLSDAGTVDLRRVIGRGLLGKPRGKLIDLAVEAGVLAPEKPPVMPFVRQTIVGGRVLRMGGPPVDNVAIDEEGQVTLVRLIAFSALLGLGLGYLCFRNVLLTLMVFMVGGVSAVGSLAIVYWSGSSVDAILMSMPSLVYVLGLSGAVHIVNYYRETAHEKGVVGAPLRALKHGFLPCTLAAVTTALGLLSLCQSNIFPIRKFGFFSAVGVVATLALLFTYLPSALQLWPPRVEGIGRADRGFNRRIHAFYEHMGDWLIKHHVLVTGATIVLMILGCVGLTRLETSIQLLKLFDSESKIIRDYTWLEANVGQLVPMELVVRVDQQSQYPTAEERRASGEATAGQRAAEHYQFSFLERVELVAHVQEAVEDVFGSRGQAIVGRALSAATFTPPVVDPLDAQRATLNLKLEENRERLMKESYIALDEDNSELWRISVRLGALNDVDYGAFVYQLKRVVEPVLTAYSFRDSVLKTIEAGRDPGAYEGNPWNNSSIAILGAADPRELASKSRDRDVAEPRQGAARDVATGNAGRTLEQMDDEALGVHHVFAKVLGDLLRAKGYQGKRAGRVPKRYLVWHDPIARPLKENATSEQWAQMLAGFDCVVLLRDHPDYDVDFIRQHAHALVDARRHGFNPATDETAKQQERPIDVTYTGIVPIVYKAQRTLLESLISSLGWSFVMITAVMILLLRIRKRQLVNIPGGLVAMVANVFPVIVVFGFMGLRGIIVDIGTMMTASVAMGVAVDDTIHFLTWFREGVRDGMERREAIRYAYRRVALAMTQTTFISGLGLSVFALSTFTPTQCFGLMMCALMFTALVGDLFILPALLAGPLGKYLAPQPAPRDRAAAGGGADAAPTANREVPDVLPIGTGAAQLSLADRPARHPPRERRERSV